MAGDWLKVEKDTPEKPEILGMAALLRRDPDDVFGKCFRFWRWADSRTTDGTLRGVTSESIDALIRCENFADALSKVGWLKIKKGEVRIPEFQKHMSESAKQRALTAKRVAKHKRQKINGEVTHEALPREEREESERKPIAKSKGDRKSSGASAPDGNNASTVRNQSPRSPINAGEGEEEAPPIDLSDVDWSHVEAIAEKVGRKVPPLTEDDRRAWFRYAVLADVRLGESWIVDAAEAVVNATQTRKSRQAHFVGVLKAKAAEKGIEESVFLGIVRRIEIPGNTWKSGILEIRR